MHLKEQINISKKIIKRKKKFNYVIFGTTTQFYTLHFTFQCNTNTKALVLESVKIL